MEKRKTFKAGLTTNYAYFESALEIIRISKNVVIKTLVITNSLIENE